MKKLSSIIFLAVTALCLVSLFACAKPPLDEMNRADAAVGRAENDPDVVTYALVALERARDALASMHTEADAKRYDAAKQLADEAERLADKAISDAKLAADRAKRDAETAVAGLDNAVAETEQTVQSARKTGQKGVDFAQIDKDLLSARSTVNEAVKAQSESRYREAIDKSQYARGALSAINSKLSQKVFETNRKK
jgi:hypothetical protein